eukprot:65506_1
MFTPQYLKNNRDIMYGSMDKDDDMIEGYCLVFETKTKYCELYIEGNKLMVFGDSLKKNIKWNQTFKNMDNLLIGLDQRHIDYKILKSQHEHGKWIFVIVTAKEYMIENWAERHRVDVQINATNAIRAGRKLPDFALAHHTKLDRDDDNNNDFSDSDNEPEFKKQDTFSVSGHEEMYPLLPKTLWYHIHIPFETSLDRRIFQPAMNRNKSHDSKYKILNQHLYLRLLFEFIEEDEPLGGAAVKMDKYITHKYHPLKHYFALNHYCDNRPKTLNRSYKCLCFYLTSVKDFDIYCDEIRSYYGEAVAFYFVFLIYYTYCLIPMAIIGTTWFIIELYFDSVEFHGELIIVLVAIIWAVLVNQFWYRKEYAYRFKWGMLKYEQIQIPRSQFDGIRIVSTQNGTIIEDYENKSCHWCKILFSLSTMLFCLLLVISMVIGIWTLQSDYREDYYIGTGLSFLLSLQIVIMNGIYTKFAIMLNNWEGHKLESDWYNNLVVKRIIFTVVNYNYSLFYIAYWDDREAYQDNDVRLYALRQQLIILFLMAIFYQNFSEIVIPIWLPKLFQKCKYCCECCRKSQVSDDELTRSLVTESPSGLKINDEIINDIKQQIYAPLPPDILDNTAEIIVIHGYIMMFAVVFPLMPLLAICNNYLELKVDFYNLTKSQRGVPYASDGIGVWKDVIAVFNIIAIFSNLALVTFRTNTISEVIGDDKYVQIEFFFISCIILLFVLIFLRVCIQNISHETKDDIARQELCQRELLHIARKHRNN